MDEGSIVFVGLAQNKEGDCQFLDTMIRTLMSQHTTFEGLLNTVQNMIKTKESTYTLTSLNDASIFLFEKGYFWLAKEFCKLAIPLCEKYGSIKTNFDCLKRIGNSYYYMDLEEEAIKYYKMALDIAVMIDDKSLQSLCHYNLGQSYYSLKQSDAEPHFKQALSLAEEYGDDCKIVAECKKILET